MAQAVCVVYVGDCSLSESTDGQVRRQQKRSDMVGQLIQQVDDQSW